MAQPTLSDVHVSRPLTNLSVAYQQSEDNFIADKVFPPVPVDFQTDLYYEYDRDPWFRSDATERAPATESAGTGYTLNHNGSYYCRPYALHHDIPDQVRKNSDSVIMTDRDATQLVTRQLLITREQKWITNFFAGSIWTGLQTGVAASPSTNQFLRWDQAGSTPMEDIRNQKLAIAQLTGYIPNTLVLGPYVGESLINNPEIVDRVKYTQLGFLDYQLLAAAFGVGRVLVPMATQNTAAEGAALSMSFMYGKSALLVYSAPAPGLMVPSGGYTFCWQGYASGTPTIAIKRWRKEEIESDRVEGIMCFDMKKIGADLGTWFATCVS